MENQVGTSESGTCDICKTECHSLARKYYKYDVDCECCGGAAKDYHFEIVKHCFNCEPKPPKKITASMIPNHTTPAESGLKKLKEAFKDKEYKNGWAANIAMAYQDAASHYMETHKKTYLNVIDRHVIANNAAENFINQLKK